MIETFGSTLLMAPTWILTYLLYSSIAISVAWALCRHDAMASAVSRMRVWKLSLLLPLPLSLIAVCTTVPWLPEFRLSNTRAETRSVIPLMVTESHSLPIRSRGSLSMRSDSEATLGNAGSRSRARTSGPATERVASGKESYRWFARVIVALSLLWPFGMVIGLVCLTRDLYVLRRLVRSSRVIEEGPLHAQFSSLCCRMGVHRRVQLFASSSVESPLAAGVVFPYIVLPSDWIAQLPRECRGAVIAHELSHVARCDAAFNLLTQIVRRVCWFQPLNVIACRGLRQEMEYVADQDAARVIESPTDLAHALVQLAERLLAFPDATKSSEPAKRPERRTIPAIAAGMSFNAGGLRSRVSAVLSLQNRLSEPIAGTKMVGYSMLICIVLLMGVPRFEPPQPPSPLPTGESAEMHSLINNFGFLTGLFAAVAATPDDALGQAETERSDREETSGFPEGLERFSGMLIGELVERDIERGNFQVKVQYVARVWENNKASSPRSVVGKTVTVNGITGKWLDELLLVRPGETIEFEAQHRGGAELTFPGEWLKKVPKFDPEQHPVPPKGFRGFAGMVTGKIIKKNQTSRELHLRIDSIEGTFEKDRSRSAKDVVGKQIVLAGFWARMSKPFEKLEKGDRIRAGVLHRVPESDHFTVVEMAEKIGPTERSVGSVKQPTGDSVGIPSGMQGFRGILRGKLVSKDVEKGVLIFTADRVTRTWKQSKASDTSSSRGHVFLVKGISGKWTDVLITMKKGDLIEVEAFHHGGDHLDFVAEWLKKVE